VRLRCVRAASGCLLAASGPLLGCSWAASGLCLDCGWTAAGLPILLAPAWAPASSWCQVFPRLLKAFCGFSWASPRLLLGCHGCFWLLLGSSSAPPGLLLAAPRFCWALVPLAASGSCWALSLTPLVPREPDFPCHQANSPKESSPRPRGADGASRLPQVRHRRVVLFSCLRPALRTWNPL
jgi:hypothetical protein